MAQQSNFNPNQLRNAGGEWSKDGSGASITSVEHIKNVLAELPEKSQLIIGPDVFTLGADGWTDNTKAITLSDAAMAEGPATKLLDAGVRPGVNLSDEQKAQLAQQLALEISKNVASTKRNIPLLVFGLAAASDWTSTSVALGRGLKEGNPVIAWAKTPAGIVSAGVGIDAVGAYAWMKMTENHKVIQAVGFYTAAIFRGYLTVHNIQAMRHQR